VFQYGERRSPAVRFAWRLLVHQKRRTAVAASGIAFAILVIFMQLGFYNAVVNTALAISSRLDADLVLVSARFIHLNATGSIRNTRLFQAFSAPSVERAMPLYLHSATWREPASGVRCQMLAMGIPLADGEPLELEGVSRQLEKLEPVGTLLLDRRTPPRCAPTRADGKVEIRGQAAWVVGDFELGVGFLADGALLMSDESFARLFRRRKLEGPHLGLLKLRAGSNPSVAQQELRRILPEDTRVLTRAELSRLQMRHWVENTAVGNVLGLGCIAGFFVGLVILHEVLSTDIRNQLPFYATLEAMGYGRRMLRRFVLQGSWILASLGFAPALVLALVIFHVIHQQTRFPILLSPGLALLVFVLSFLMCTAAALVSMQKLRRADPAELFRA
jgi:putative ABC transport system permease protein